MSAVARRLSFPFLLVMGPIDCGRGLNLKTNRCPTGRVGTKVPYRHLRTMHVRMHGLNLNPFGSSRIGVTAHCSLRLKRHRPHVLMPLLLPWTRWSILMPNSASWCLHISTADGSYHRDRIHSMSDGYRGTSSLFADIAYRMAMLNPALGDRVLKTPGVVMIDEIDLHLYPR